MAAAGSEVAGCDRRFVENDVIAGGVTLRLAVPLRHWSKVIGISSVLIWIADSSTNKLGDVAYDMGEVRQGVRGLHGL